MVTKRRPGEPRIRGQGHHLPADLQRVMRDCSGDFPTTEVRTNHGDERARVHPGDIFAHDHGDRRPSASAGGSDLRDAPVGRAKSAGRHRPSAKHPPVSSIERVPKRKSVKKQARRRRGKSSLANRRASDRSAWQAPSVLQGCGCPRCSWRYAAHPGGSFGDWRAYARRYSILTASGIFRRRRAPGLGLAGRVLRSQLIQSPFANAHPRAPQDNLHPTKCKRPSS
jgi:hypothetical protein